MMMGRLGALGNERLRLSSKRPCGAGEAIFSLWLLPCVLDDLVGLGSLNTSAIRGLRNEYQMKGGDKVCGNQRVRVNLALGCYTLEHASALSSHKKFIYGAFCCIAASLSFSTYVM